MPGVAGAARPLRGAAVGGAARPPPRPAPPRPARSGAGGRRSPRGARGAGGLGDSAPCAPWPRACTASRGAASGCSWVSRAAPRCPHPRGTRGTGRRERPFPARAPRRAHRPRPEQHPGVAEPAAGGTGDLAPPHARRGPRLHGGTWGATPAPHRVSSALQTWYSDTTTEPSYPHCP
jgi:hypothetical protein